MCQALCGAVLGVGDASDLALPSKPPRPPVWWKTDTDTNGEEVVIGAAQDSLCPEDMRQQKRAEQRRDGISLGVGNFLRGLVGRLERERAWRAENRGGTTWGAVSGREDRKFGGKEYKLARVREVSVGKIHREKWSQKRQVCWEGVELVKEQWILGPKAKQRARERGGGWAEDGQKWGEGEMRRRGGRNGEGTLKTLRVTRRGEMSQTYKTTRRWRGGSTERSRGMSRRRRGDLEACRADSMGMTHVFGLFSGFKKYLLSTNLF